MAVQNGGPNSIPRSKTYSAASGYVYQYQFTGSQRAAEADRFTFKTSQDRRTTFDVHVEVPMTSLVGEEQRLGRSFSPTEKYAVSKMALFAALDEAGTPGEIPDPVVVLGPQVREIVNTLDL